MLVLALFNAMFWLLPLPPILGYGLGVALTVWWLADAFLIPAWFRTRRITDAAMRVT